MTYYYEYDFIDGNIVRVPLARLYIDGPDVPPRFRLPDANTPGKTVVLEDGTVVITRSPDTTSYFADEVTSKLISRKRSGVPISSFQSQPSTDFIGLAPSKTITRGFNSLMV